MSSIKRILLLAAIFCLAFLHEVEVCRAHLPQQLLAAHMSQRQLLPKLGAKKIINKSILPLVPLVGPQINCKVKCHFRCSVASRYKMCFRACSTCCQRCNCVPPGTSGNANVCPCYAKMTTFGGRKKCP